MTTVMDKQVIEIGLRRAPSWPAAIPANLAFAGAYVRHNLASALEYRVSFVTQVAGMVINDLFWVAFWVIYFRRFPVVHGWSLTDVITLWSIGALSFGLAAAICGNSANIGGMIARGEIDYHLVLPKNVFTYWSAG